MMQIIHLEAYKNSQNYASLSLLIISNISRDSGKRSFYFLNSDKEEVHFHSWPQTLRIIILSNFHAQL